MAYFEVNREAEKTHTMKKCIGRWIWFVGSVVLMMMSGFYLAFNVYAVDLKKTFEFSQTQVELLASFDVGGTMLNIAGSIIFTKYGARPCYIAAWILVTASSILMWMSTAHQYFFKQWTILLCLLLFVNTAGLSVTQVCCFGTALLQFPARHTGKVVGLYYAVIAFGKIYYGALYEIFFKKDHNLGGLFLVVAAGISIAIVICFAFHITTTNDWEETEHLSLENSTTQHDSSRGPEEANTSTETTSLIPRETWTIKEIILSRPVHLLMCPSLFQVSCAYAVLNNATSIAESVNIENKEVIIYVMSVGIIISRVVFGFAFDHFKSPLAGLIIFLVVNLACGVSVIGAILRLDEITVYLICIVVAVGTGGFISLTLSILTSICGSQNYNILMGIYNVLISILSLLSQIFTGQTFDYTLGNSDEYFCRQCFQWSFVLWISVSFACAVVNSFSIYLFCKGQF